jgi:DNA-binding Lrp family transcriptional regulator
LDLVEQRVRLIEVEPDAVIEVAPVIVASPEIQEMHVSTGVLARGNVEATTRSGASRCGFIIRRCGLGNCISAETPGQRNTGSLTSAHARRAVAEKSPSFNPRRLVHV